MELIILVFLIVITVIGIITITIKTLKKTSSQKKNQTNTKSTFNKNINGSFKSSKFKVGDKVRHRLRVDCGLGVILKITENQLVTVEFSGAMFSGIPIKLISVCNEIDDNVVIKATNIKPPIPKISYSVPPQVYLKGSDTGIATNIKPPIPKISYSVPPQVYLKGSDTGIATNKMGYSFKSNDSKVCPRCSGKGYINSYQHIQNGICFLCHGTG